ncbi:MAG: hypothetical protein M3P08_15725 [Thermoproteota archaeon]|jgi:hypothetical protein|nr:hypothetical protein [Thermoproteota archaeon]
MIKELKVQSARRDIEDSVVKDTQLVNQESFEKLIFSNKLEDYKQFIKFSLNKVNNERT